MSSSAARVQEALAKTLLDKIDFSKGVKINHKSKEDDGTIEGTITGAYLVFGSYRLELTTRIDHTGEGIQPEVALKINLAKYRIVDGSLARLCWTYCDYDDDSWNWRVFAPPDIDSLYSNEELQPIKELISRLGPDERWKTENWLDETTFFQTAKIVGEWAQQQAKR